jgi:hypothetical protein
MQVIVPKPAFLIMLSSCNFAEFLRNLVFSTFYSENQGNPINRMRFPIGCRTATWRKSVLSNSTNYDLAIHITSTSEFRAFSLLQFRELFFIYCIYSTRAGETAAGTEARGC